MNTASSEIEKLIDCLNSLHDGDRAIDLLVEHGKESVAPLRKFLIEGEPSHIYQPRQRAVNALERLEAKEVLIEYLCTPKEIPDPVFRFGEEAVENTAARALARWQTDEVFEVLLRIARTRTLPGVIESLGLFHRTETIPLFIEALMDDVSRIAAENALMSMGDHAKPALIAAVRTPIPSDNYESPSALLLRRCALRILARMQLSVKDWSQLKGSLADDDPEISVAAAGIALRIADSEEKKVAVETLIGKIPHVNWYVQTEIENCLVAHYDRAKDEITSRIAERRMQPEKAQVMDRVLQILLNTRKRSEESGNAGY